MGIRTTIVLDERTRRAARELAQREDCSVSEAIRRAVLRQRDSVAGVPSDLKARRQRVLARLVKLFAGSDPEAEVGRLKLEDASF